MTVTVAGKTREVSVEYKNIKNMYMRMGENGSIRITCSRYVTKKQIREFILSKESWIRKAEAVREEKDDLCSYGANGQDAMWLGKRLPVHCKKSNRDFLLVDEDGLTFFLREDTEENRMRVFYSEGGKQILQMVRDRRGDLDRMICDAYGKPYPKITVKYMTSRWGSCTPQRAHISICSRLVHFPPA